MTGQSGPLERETIQGLILPAVAAAGWTDDQIAREYPLKAAQVVSQGDVSRQIGDGLADIVLEATPGTPVVVIEAKRIHRTATDAMQQAVRYAQQLDVPPQPPPPGVPGGAFPRRAGRRPDRHRKGAARPVRAAPARDPGVRAVRAEMP